MSAIPTDLNQRLCSTLVRSTAFNSDEALCALFTDVRIAPWRDRISDNTPNRQVRVNTLINDLHDQVDADGNNALALFLSILAGQHPSGDSLHSELHALATELDPTLPLLESPPLSPSLPPDAQQKRARDVENLKWLMSKVHIPTLQSHINELPSKIWDWIFHFWENFSAVIDDYRFHLYDQEALDLVRELYNAWNETFSFYRCFRSARALLSADYDIQDDQN